MNSLNDLKLHDSLLFEILISWSDNTVELVIDHYKHKIKHNDYLRLLFHQATKINIPMDAPWGESARINTTKSIGQEFIIQMQSGDEIKLNAYSFEVKY